MNDKPTMKTLFIYSNFEDMPKFFTLPGDYRHLDGVVINGCAPGIDDDDLTKEEENEIAEDHEAKCDELSRLMYNRDGTLKVTFFSAFPAELEVQAVVNVGYAP